LKASPLALLTEQGSLTDLMQQLMLQPPVLNCLFQGRDTVAYDEARLLGIKPRILGHIREITMGTKSKDWLFARTVIPMSTLRGPAKRLAKMNGTPLGKVLFGAMNAERTQMTLNKVFAEEVGLLDFNIPEDFLLWQRRSVFQLSTGPLMISEIFLPDCPVYEFSDLLNEHHL